MKQVEIISKIVGRGESEGITSAIPSINLSGFALKSDLLTLEKKFSDFLNVPIIDGTINRWNELETFLAGISEDYNLLSLLNGKADKSYVDTNFVTLGTKQTITGEKNFTGGLRVNNSPSIYYDATNKYWKLEGDLLVTGGVSMYSDDSEFTPSTIMDGVVVDGTSIRKNPTTGALEVIGGSGATVKYPLSWSGFNQGSYDGSVAQSFYIPTKLSEFVNDKSFATTSDLSSYLPLTGGTINGLLVISNASWGNQLTINRYNSNGNSVIQYTNSDDGILGSIGVAGKGSGSNAFQPVFNDKNKTEYQIYHRGNLTPTEILTQLKTVDGAGSGLDADTLDGVQLSGLLTSMTYTAMKEDGTMPSISAVVGGVTKSISLGYEGLVRKGYAYSGVALDSYWVKIASITLPYEYDDYAATLCVENPYNSGGSYLVKWACRTGETTNSSVRILGSAQHDFRVYNSGAGSTITFELWANLRARYGGIAYTVIQESDRGEVNKSVLATYYNTNFTTVQTPTLTNWVGHTFDSIGNNSASATKLQTPRTIWGQSFDGTGNIDGNFVLPNNVKIKGKSSSGEEADLLYRSTSNNLLLGLGIAHQGNSTYIYGKNVLLNYGNEASAGLMLSYNGNVLIGTTTDSGYKLDVNGTVQITNQGDGVKLLRFNTERPWVFKQVGTGVGANLVLQAEHDAKAFIIAHVSGNSAVEFFTGGSAYTAFNTVVRPKVSDSIDLGAVNYYWNNSYINNGYFSNKLEINGIPVYKLQDNVLYIDSNLVVRGGITMYGGEFDSTDIMDAIVTDETTILNDNGVLKLNPNIQLGGISSSEVLSIVSGAGYITSSALSGYLPKSGGMIENTVADALSLKRQNSSAGVYISFNNSTNGWLGGIGIGGSSTSIGIQPFVMLSSGTHQIYHSGNLTKLSQLTDDVVNGKYIPLSGGTITTSNIALTINRTGVLNSAIRYMIDGVEQGSLGFYKTLGLAYYDATNVGWYKIWHEHNDGSGSGLDADLLDGKHNGELTAAFVNAQVLTTDIDIPANLPGTGVYINNSGAEIGTCGTYDTVLTVGTAGRIFQFKGTKDSDIIQYRGASGNNGLRGWKTLLHSDNYSSYALPITGGTLEGALTVKGLIRSSVVNSASASWSQFLNYANASIGVGSISVAGVHPIIGWATAVGSYTTRFVIGATSDSETFGTMYIAVGTNNGGTSGRRLMLNSSGICQWEGDILSSGGITMYSDQRKKTILNHVELSLKQIADAPLIEHYYNSDQNKTTHVGSIAQYWAGLNDWFCKLDAEGFYTMEIQNCALASAISIARHLEKYETKTDKKIRMLKKRITELEDKLERLEGGNYGIIL